jgi:2-methylisocitrate lyase-like PEP mutase family enzyme
VDRSQLAAKADALRALHAGAQPLILPNAWDVASARLVADAGYPAVATTSGGVAAAYGYPDGEAITPDEMFAAIARIARAVDVPVTADIEAGYELEPDRLVAMLLEAGAVGCNLEDSDPPTKALFPVLEQTQKVAAVKAAGRDQGVDIALNARVDVYIRLRDATPDEQLDVALARARAYAGAGADCVFPIFCVDETAIGTLCRETSSAVNVLAVPGAPPIARLAELGVRRVSFGSGIMRISSDATRAAVEAIRAGSYPWQ